MNHTHDLIARLAHALRARTTAGTRFPHDLNPALLDGEARELLKSYQELIEEAVESLACEREATQRQIALLSTELRKTVSW